MSAPESAGRNVEHTATRLTLALLSYFVLVTLVITLSPFDFGLRRFRVSLKLVPSDLIANIALFVPLGFMGRGLTGTSPRSRWRSVWIAALFSLGVETAQIFIRGRYVSPVDVAANTAGACVGLLVRDWLERWSLWHPRLVGRIGLDIPLVGLLYLLVPQLWMSSVGLVEDARRSATTLLLGCAGSIVLVALHRHRWQAAARVAAHVVPPLAFLWFMTGVLPFVSASPMTFGALAVTVVGLTWWLVRRTAASDEQRFEVATLRWFIPVFMLYLVAAALWPPFRSLTSWHGAIGFANRLNGAGMVDILLLLEQVSGFTLLGYALAEWRGRRELTLAEDLPGIARAAVLFAIALELAQGFLVGPGASAFRAVLATSGALYGAAVYHLARAHVRALREASPEQDAAIEAA
jgi:VanZ family protein